MRRASLILVAAAIAVGLSLWVPDRAAAQSICAICDLRESGEGGRDRWWWSCSIHQGAGSLSCHRPNDDRCKLSSNEDGSGDCDGLALRLDGRAVRYASVAPPIAPTGTGGLLRNVGPSSRNVRNVGSAIVRHACSGAIIQRGYTPVEAQAIRAALRHIQT